MDCNPDVSLSFLYKNDPFYSLCLSDLMSAPQSVTNQFLKEQRNLTESLKRIDRHQLIRLRQLNEEKRQFALLMSRKLAPKDRLSSVERDRESRRTFSSSNFTDLIPAKHSFRNRETMSAVSSYRRSPTLIASSNDYGWNTTGLRRVSQPFFITTLPKNKYQFGQAPTLLTKNERLSSAQRSENISKTISRATYKSINLGNGTTLSATSTILHLTSLPGGGLPRWLFIELWHLDSTIVSHPPHQNGTIRRHPPRLTSCLPHDQRLQSFCGQLNDFSLEASTVVRLVTWRSPIPPPPPLAKQT
ncbi:uncharacterized protein RCH25_036500 [Pelodytes ibericus]